MFNRKQYEEDGYPEHIIATCEAMTRDERRDWHMVIEAAGAGNEIARSMFATKFGESASLYNCHAASMICLDEFSEQECEHMSRKLEHDLDVLAKFQTVPDSYIEKLKDESMSKLLYYRMEAGLTQKELAKRSGMNPVQISRIERGDIKLKNMSLANAAALAAVLGISAEDLL